MWIQICLAILAVLIGYFAIKDSEAGDPLFLTPLLKSGEISKAAELSKVTEFYPEVTSHSGFITVNEETKSHLFFWYFPAIENSESAPVILWTDGGPGKTCFFSVFSINGAFSIDPTLPSEKVREDSVKINPSAWNRKYHVIQIDNPVGVGFSFTKTDNGYVKTTTEGARDLYQFLLQFFQIFPHLRNNPFYNAGVSYGAKFAVKTAFQIYQGNVNNPQAKINLAGVIVDSPAIHPVELAASSDLFSSLGLMDEKGLSEFRKQELEIRRLIEKEEYVKAVMQYGALKEITQKLTGFAATSNVFKESNDDKLDYTKLVTSSAVRHALHVGPSAFSWMTHEPTNRMLDDLMRSALPELETLLQEGFRFLGIQGNLDALTSHTGFMNFIKALKSPDAQALLRGEREVWRVNGRVAGYVKSSGKMSIVTVRNCGHGVVKCKPAILLDIITKFTSDKPLI